MIMARVGLGSGPKRTSYFFVRCCSVLRAGEDITSAAVCNLLGFLFLCCSGKRDTKKQ